MFNLNTILKQFEFIVSNGIPVLMEEGPVTVVGVKDKEVQKRHGNAIYVYADDLEEALAMLREYIVNKGTKSWRLEAVYDSCLNYVYFLTPTLVWNSDIEGLYISTPSDKPSVYISQVNETIDAEGNTIKSLVGYTPLEDNRELTKLKEEMVKVLSHSSVLTA